MNKSLVKLDVFDLDWETLETLPDDQVAAYSILSYAVSEANSLSGIYICQSHKYVGEKCVDSASNINRFVVLRSWSSRLFEVKEFLEFGGKKKTTSDQKLLALAEEALESFESIAEGSGFEVARDIRNEAANHYSFKAAKKNLAHINRDGDFNLYLHEHNGNCFFPIGEEVLFHARLNRRWSNVDKKAERDRLFGEWLDWNIAANGWLAQTHAMFSKELIFDVLGRNELQSRGYWVPSEFVGDFKDRLTPVFRRKIPSQ